MVQADSGAGTQQCKRTAPPVLRRGGIASIARARHESAAGRLRKNSPASFRKPLISGLPEIERVMAKSAIADLDGGCPESINIRNAGRWIPGSGLRPAPE